MCTFSFTGCKFTNFTLNEPIISTIILCFLLWKICVNNKNAISLHYKK